MECDHCGKTFSSNYSLRRHERILHNSQQKEYAINKRHEDMEESNEETVSRESETSEENSSNDDDDDVESYESDTESLRMSTIFDSPDNDTETDDDYANLLPKETELGEWQRLMIFADLHKKINMDAINGISELWTNKDYLDICVRRFGRLVQVFRQMFTILNKGDIFSQIVHEARRLRDSGYMHREAWEIAMSNRKYVIAKIMENLEDELDEYYLNRDRGITDDEEKEDVDETEEEEEEESSENDMNV